MNRYLVKATVIISLPAFSKSDAEEAAYLLFQPGDLLENDIEIETFTVEQTEEI